MSVLAGLAIVITILITGAVPRPVSAQENWRQKFGTFRVGVLSKGRPARRVQQLEPFRSLLQEAIALRVEIVPMEQERGLLEALIGGRLDYAILSATGFATAWQTCKCVDPIAAPVSADGARGFHSVLIVRNDGPSTLAGLDGKDVLVPGKHSFAGSLYPQALKRKPGSSLSSIDWKVIDSGSMDAALAAFRSGKAEAIFGWIPAMPDDTAKFERGTLFDLGSSLAEARPRYRVVWKSALLPNGPHTVRKNLPGEAKVILLEALRRLQQIMPDAHDAVSPDQGGGFEQVRLEDYQPLIDVIGQIGPAPPVK